MRAFLPVFFFVFLALGSGMLFLALFKLTAGLRARRWPHTTGRVTGVSGTFTGGEEGGSFEIRIRYAYVVEGHSYEGTTIHPLFGCAARECAHRGIESRLSAGQKVRVYYCRTAPQRSTLSVGFYTHSLFLVFLALFFLCFGLSGAFSFFHAPAAWGRTSLAGEGAAFLLSLAFYFGDADFGRGITLLEEGGDHPSPR